MAMREFMVAMVFGVAVLALSASAGAAKPEIFSKKSFDEAKDEAKAAGKLFVADATAVWCGPCKKMDKTTWIDEKVVAWMKEHAIAAQFDVDAEKDLSAKLNISAMPTIIVFKEGTEFDRTIGYKSPDDLIAWLEGAMKGDHEIDKLRKSAEADSDGKMNMQARLQLAQKLVQDRHFDEATKEFLWLWDNIVKQEPAMSGVRVSFMVGYMQRLAQQHEPAKVEFAKLRDRYQPAMDDGSADWTAATDWIALNKVVDQEEQTLKWFDRIKGDPTQKDLVAQVNYMLVELLMRKNRWADVGRMTRDPVAQAKSDARMMKMPDMDGMSKEDREQIEDSQKRFYRDRTSKLYAGCLAADREKSASGVAEVLLKELDDEQSRIMLVEMALKADQPRQEHAKWLDEADAKGDKNNSLRKLLEEGLAKKQAKEKQAS